MLIGLTGGIGSGKSAAATMLNELGAGLVDADAIAHELTAPGGTAIPAIRNEFGEAAVSADGALDRAVMRRLVFADRAAKLRLEAILHPLIGAETRRRCKEALVSGVPYVVLVVPLLIESGDYRKRVSRVAVVDCAEETQVSRVMTRSGLARDEVERIMATQVGRKERLAAADDVIDNDGDMDFLRAQVETLHRRYLELAGGTRSHG